MQREPIAIVGIGCRFPGGANSPEAFWRLLSDGVDAITDVPGDRWDIRRHYDKDAEKPGKTIASQGGFLHEPIDQFDALFFGISPREAASLDPQQRILLESTWEAFEDAGLIPAELAGTDVGIYMGGFTADTEILHLSGLNRDIINQHTATSAKLVMLSNRISYQFDFRGPSLSIDTACSSSLVALNYACQDLWEGRCSLAVSGGANIMLIPEYPIAMSKGGFLSPDSRCKAFDASANGYARGEGAGVIVLKPLSAAMADGDPIYASILSTGVNQDGHTSGITVPNAESQKALIRKVSANAGIQPSQVTYAEAHGTGTAVGDPIEAAALGEVLREDRPASSPCVIGSVKANIGHLEAAAGIAGVIKAALCLKNNAIPPQIHIKTPNPNIPFDELGLRLPLGIEPMPKGDGAAVAVVNSFGYGGTNAHAMLQEAPKKSLAELQEPAKQESGNGPWAFPLSAASHSALADLASEYADWLDATPAGEHFRLDNVGRAMALSRSHLDHRLCVFADDRAALVENLRAFAEGETTANTEVGQLTHGGSLGPVYVFTGMGPQWWGMGRQLFEAEPVYRRAVEEADEAFCEHSGWSILAEMQADEHLSKMVRTEIAQPANFVLQIGLAALWQARGVHPSAIVGHSVGEVSAAYVAGALDLSSAARVSYHRSRLQQSVAGQGSMLAVGLSPDAALELIDLYAGEVSIAAINSTSAVTLSGNTDALKDIAEVLESEKIFNRLLKVEVAYHSPQMEPLEAELRESLSGLAPAAPRTPLYSTVSGEREDNILHDADYWWRNMRDPVRFAGAVSALADDGHDLFLELGPHPVLGPSIRENLSQRGKSAEMFSSLHRDKPEIQSMLQAFGGLYAHGGEVDWKALYGAKQAHVPLPRYVWQREKLWEETERSKEDRQGPSGPPILGLRQPSPEPVWDVEVNDQYLPYLDDHKIGDLIVFPGAAFVEASLAVQREVMGQDAAVLEDVTFAKAFIVGAHEKPMLRLSYHEGRRQLEIHGSKGDGSWALNAKATLSGLRLGKVTDPLDVEALQSRLCPGPDHEAFYARLQARDLRYGPHFRTVRRLWQGDGEALAEIKAHDTLEIDPARDLLPPPILDASFQAMLATLTDVAGSATFVPVHIGRVSLFGPPSAEAWAHCRLTTVSERAVKGDIDLCDRDGNVIAEIRGLTCKPVAKHDETSERLSDLFYTLEWERADLEDILPGAVAGESDSPGRWLILSEQSGIGDALSHALASFGAVCTKATLDSGQLNGSANTAFPGGAGSDDFAQILARPDSRSLNGIVYVCGIDEAAEASDPVGATRLNRVLGLIQALCADNLATPPRLYVVTRSVNSILGSDERLSIDQAPLWGLARVAMSEHPELRCTSIDLARGGFQDDITPLAVELIGGAAEEEIALRGGNRYRHMLRRADLKDESATSERALVATTEPFELDVGALGALDSLHFRRTNRRSPCAGEIELRVRAISLNFKDALKAMGMIDDAAIEGTYFGTGIGMEVAGTVVAVGEGVEKFALGDDLVVTPDGGFLGSYVTLCADDLVSVPSVEPYSLQQLVGLPVAFVTAYYGLHEMARLKKGETVLLHSASGGVGLAAIQVARWLGAEVLATAGSAEKRDYLRSLGVEHVMDSRSLDFADQVMALTGGKGVDVVLNFLTGEALEKSLSIVASFGRFIEIGKRDIVENSGLPMAPFNRNISFSAIDTDRMLAERPAMFQRLLDEVWDLLRNGKFEPLPMNVFPIGEVSDAFRLLTQARHTGKVVVTLDDETVQAVPCIEDEALFRANGAYLITGGLGGFALVVAEWMARQGAGNIVLVGRRGLDTPGAPEAVARLQALGANVRVMAADIGDRDDVERVLAETHASMPPLRGVFHTAMVLDDDTIQRLDSSRIGRVLKPKAQGAWHLHELTADLDLDHFVLFSSVSAIMGNPGQANYVAANAYLDTLAHYRKALGLPAISINWGVLAEVGVAARDADVTAHLERLGITPMAPELAIAALERAMRSGLPQIGAMDIDWHILSKANPVTAAATRFKDLVGSGAEANDRNALASTLSEYPPGEWREALTVMVADEVSKILRMPADKLDVIQPLSALGVDSLMTVELQTAIRIRFDAEIGALELADGLSVSKIVDALFERTGLEVSEDVGDRHDPEIRNGTGHAVAGDDIDVDDLSDAELDTMLAELSAREQRL